MAITTSELAAFGGPKTVHAVAPHWPYFTDADIEAVRQQMLRSREDWREACTAAGGGTAEAFEQRFATAVGRRYAIATSGGGPALHIACLAAGVGLGDEVITTPYSWGQTVSCILQAGGIPVFADIEPGSLTLDPAAIEPLISERTKAIVLVHIFGVPADMTGIMAVARKHGLAVIEDCAQAQGAQFQGRPVGSFGDFGCFSIGSGKNIAAGDGGVLVCDDQRLYELALLAGMHPGRAGREIQDPELKERVDSLIYTYRIHAFTAALANSQMDRLDELNGWRRGNRTRLEELLADVPGIAPLPLSTDRLPAWHMGPWSFVPEDLPGVTRTQYVRALQAEGVPISDGYVRVPIPLRRIFQQKEWWLGNGLPWAATERGRGMVYTAGSWPVAERRCAELDLNLGGGAWWCDVSELLEQIAAAFRKVAAAADRLHELPA